MAPPGTKVVASNRQARRDFEILDTLEVGMVLRGSEVKSLREAKVQLAESHARIEGDELWLVNLHIAPWQTSSAHELPEPARRRKLLAHRDQIERWGARVDQDRLSLVPLALYFKDGRAKLELALARGRRKADKRQAIAQRDAEKEARKAIGRAAKGMVD
jgi:SsrA-binding protein